jgi:oligopeptide/dipeptide ABC transporter ATP-binding protein
MADSANGNKVLEISNLKTYFYQDGGVVKAVDDVSFRVDQGETVGIVGESGCGKTITSWSVMRILPSNGRIEQGEILLHTVKDADGKPLDVAKQRAESDIMCNIRGGEIGMIFQEPMTSLSPVHTVGSQICEAIQLHEDVSDEKATERAVDLLGRVGIPRPHEIVNEYSFRLSGGMRQRAMIAVALACNPHLLIADEPTTALDVTIQAQILNLMKHLQREFRMSIMFITHDLGVIAEMADRVIVMYLGKVVESASAEAVFYNPKHPYSQALLKSIPGSHVQTKSRLATIRGSVPSPYAEIHGCAFYGRCPHRIDGTCNQDVPTLQEVTDGQSVRCWLYEEK